jgi:hypothetical protein
MISFEVDGIEYRAFNHIYAISSCGKVLRKHKPYEPIMRKDGYTYISRAGLTHRIIAFLWIEKKNEDANDVHHKNGIRSDNRADNLEWISKKEHIGERHKGQIGKYIRTEATKQLMREFRTGMIDNEETKAKKAEILNRFRHATICSYKGIQYLSIAAGARAAGFKISTFRFRCLSKNFPEYQIIELYHKK